MMQIRRDAEATATTATAKAELTAPPLSKRRAKHYPKSNKKVVTTTAVNKRSKHGNTLSTATLVAPTHDIQLHHATLFCVGLSRFLQIYHATQVEQRVLLTTPPPPLSHTFRTWLLHVCQEMVVPYKGEMQTCQHFIEMQLHAAHTFAFLRASGNRNGRTTAEVVGEYMYMPL
jgi:hypothetical protein